MKKTVIYALLALAPAIAVGAKGDAFYDQAPAAHAVRLTDDGTLQARSVEVGYAFDDGYGTTTRSGLVARPSASIGDVALGRQISDRLAAGGTSPLESVGKVRLGTLNWLLLAGFVGLVGAARRRPSAR